MKMLVGYVVLVTMLPLQAMEEKVEDGQQAVALRYLTGQGKARTNSHSFRRFEELDPRDVVVTMKWYDSSGKLLKKTIDGDCNDVQEITEQFHRAFELITRGDYEGLKELLSQHTIPVNHVIDGETLLMRAINAIQSDHWEHTVQLLLDQGARADSTDTENSTFFEAPSLQADTIVAMFSDDDIRSQKLAAADTILQLLIDRANEEYDKDDHL